MSTRSAIARLVKDDFVGRYHHWDGYPTALGETLWKLLSGHFKGDLTAMLRVLLDEHPAGWSTINDADFTKTPGYIEHPREPDGRPLCYCHGDRTEEANEITSASECGLEWAYVFNEADRTLRVLEHVHPTGEHMAGMFGCDTGKGLQWRVCWEGPLDGPEPDWSAIENGGT